jgi:hypothetical protein
VFLAVGEIILVSSDNQCVHKYFGEKHLEVNLQFSNGVDAVTAGLRRNMLGHSHTTKDRCRIK